MTENNRNNPAVENGAESNMKIWNELSAYKAKRKKKKIIHGILSPICNIVFLICLIPITIIAIRIMQNTEFAEFVRSLIQKYALNVNGRNVSELFIEKIYNYDNLTVLICALMPFVISFVIALLVSAILAVSVHPKKAKADGKDLRNDEQAMRICKTLVSVMPELNYRGQLIFAAIIPVALLTGAIFLRRLEFPSILLTFTTCVAVYAVMLLFLEISNFLNSLIYRFGPSTKKLSPLSYEILTSDRFSSVLSDIGTDGIKLSKKRSEKEYEEKDNYGDEKYRAKTGAESYEDFENQCIGLKIYYRDSYKNSECITVSVFVDEICMGTLVPGCNAFYVGKGVHTLKAEICNTNTDEVKTISGGGFRVEDGFYETDLSVE